MQLDFFKEERPKKPWEDTDKPKAVPKPVITGTMGFSPDCGDIFSKPRPYTVVKQGLITTIWNEEVRNSQ